MKTFSLAIVYTLAFYGAIALLQQIQVTDSLINTLFQAPMVLGLIYLVLKLEDKRQASAMVREETFRSTMSQLLSVIVELSGMVRPGKMTSEDMGDIREFIKSTIIKGDKSQ